MTRLLLTQLVLGAVFSAAPLAALVLDPALEAKSLDVLLAALRAVDMSDKQAALLLGYSKGQWSEIRSGQRHMPSHTRMLNLGFRFWLAYWPKWMAVIADEHAAEAVRDRMAPKLHMAKAEFPAVTQEVRRA